MYGIEEGSLKKYRERHLPVLIPGSTSIMASFIDAEKTKKCPHRVEKCLPYFQGKTGYCWLSSMLQCISLYLWDTKGKMVLFNQETLIFFDKLEKANYFLSLVMEYLEQPIDAQINSYIFNNVMTDKGQWNMACNLIKKYGLPLADQGKECRNMSTTELNASISYLLRVYAFQMRHIWENSKSMEMIENVREMAMQATYDLLADFYGESDNWSEQYTYYVGEEDPFPFDEYISIYVNDDAQGTQYEIEFDGNVRDGRKNSFLGVSNDLFDELIEKQIDLQGFCWCTGDAGKFYVKNRDMFDDSVFDLSSLGISDILKDMDRSAVRKCHMGSMSHAMVLLAIHKECTEKYYIVYDSAYALDHGKVCRMSESWFGKFLYQGVVHKSLLPDAMVKNIAVKNVVPWEFFGI